MSQIVVSPIENEDSVDQDAELGGPSQGNSPRVENSTLEVLANDFPNKNRLAESQRELLKLLKPKKGKCNNGGGCLKVKRNVSTTLPNPIESVVLKITTLILNVTDMFVIHSGY